jgi:G3E family GTPase
VDATAGSIDALLETATALFESEPLAAPPGAVLGPQRRYRLQLNAGAQFQLEPGAAGAWALFTEHAPVEFGLHLHAATPLQQREFGSHHHDLAVGSIGLTDPRALDANRVNDWLSYLLQSRGADILRMKGVLNLRGESRRYVFHGVHMVFDGRLERPWSPDAPRRSRLVFIGRNLDRQELEAGFESCVA